MMFTSSPEAITWSTPAVTTEDPYGLLSEVILFSEDSGSDRAAFSSSLFQFGNQSLCSGFVHLTVVLGIQVSLGSSLEFVGSLVGSSHFFNLRDETVADGLLTEIHTETVFSVVFEQGVSPCRTTTGRVVYGVRSCRCGTAPDGGTTGALEMYILSPKSWVIRRA